MKFSSIKGKIFFKDKDQMQLAKDSLFGARQVDQRVSSRRGNEGFSGGSAILEKIRHLHCKMKKYLIALVVVGMGAISPASAQFKYSLEERQRLVDFYNGGRAVGWIESACTFASKGLLSEEAALMIVDLYAKRSKLHTRESIEGYQLFEQIKKGTMHESCAKKLRQYMDL